VPYRKDQKQFMCPCHSSVFNTKGEVIGGPAPRPMDLFPISIENGQIVVDTGNPITRDKFDPSQLTRA
jgi:Rieske Fe-S protein